jgi:S1-C subfamily serine protease
MDDDDDDDFDEDDRPRRKSKRAAGGGGKGLLIGLLAGGGVAIIAAVVLVIVLNNKGEDSPARPNPIAQRPDLPQDQQFKDAVKPGDQQPPRDGGGFFKPEDKGDVKDVKKKEELPPPRNDGGLTVEVLDRTKKATTFIRVTDKSGRQASGSGFFSAGTNLVLTNAHVVGMLDPESPPPAAVEVVLDSGLPTERKFPGSVVTVDRDSDLAVLRVPIPEGTRPQPLDILKSATLRETQKVYVVGYPFGEQLGKNVTVSESSVSSLRYDQGNRLKQV